MKKIADFEKEHICRHPDHDPPTMIVLQPGIYEHKCPACGQKQIVVQPPKPTCMISTDGYKYPYHGRKRIINKTEA
jgi:hypothetical protein